MRKINFIVVSIFALVLSACQEDQPTLDAIVVPSNLSVSSIISIDGSGIVEFTASAANAITYTFKFSDGEEIVTSDGKATKRFTQVGLNTYDYTVIAYGTGGVSSSGLFQVEVESDFSDFEAIELLTGGDIDEDGEVVTTSSKKWYLAASQPGHLGVGATLAFLPDQFWFPAFFAASPFEKCAEEISSCLCDDELTFTLNSSGNQLTYELNNNGSTFFNAGHQDIVGVSVGEDACFTFDTSGSSIVSLAPTSVDWAQVPDPAFNPRGTVMNFSNSAFMGYYVSSSSYEILEITDDFLYVRTIDGNDSNLAWYHKFSTTSVDDQSGGSGGETLNSVFNNLVWSDEFDVDGAPNPANWTYDLGAGGWGNGEAQTYTDNAENVKVEDGMLKITARSTGGGGSVNHYYDDVTLVASGGATSSVENFEGVAPDFTTFGGNATSVISNPDASGINTSTMVAESTKPNGAEFWAGSYFDLTAPLDLATYSSIQVKTWSPMVGDTIKLKLENQANPDENFEVNLLSTVANEWETLTYDFSAAPAGTYDRVVLFFDFGVSPEGDGGYTSARIKTENLYEFTYGRVEIRAKLPSAGGTWPALWTLGANFDTVGWPASGEIDIMEHVGNTSNVVSSAIHYPDNFAGNAITTSTPLATATTEFHNYTMEWTADSIKFAIDGNLIALDFANSSTTPFNNDFFFIMNIAMGGTLGGSIDPAFTEDTMEVDYIRVYQ